MWTVDDDVPGLPGATRRMSVVLRPSGELVFFNAVPVPDVTLDQLRALGRPAHLLVPNQFHTIDVAAFIDRLGVTAWVPDVATPVLSARFPCRPASAFPKDEGLRLFTVVGFRTKELALVAERTLFTGDLVTNAPHGPGLMGLVMRVAGFTGPEPTLPYPVRRRVQTDRQAVRELLLTLAGLELERLVPTHGAIVEGDVAGVLRKVAAAL